MLTLFKRIIATLLEAYFFYEIKRFDIKGREFLRTLGKYYIVDIGLRNYLLGFRDRDTGHVLENVVYLELLRRGYDVAIGKIDRFEVDFIATKLTKSYISKLRSRCVMKWCVNVSSGHCKKYRIIIRN